MFYKIYIQQSCRLYGWENKDTRNTANNYEMTTEIDLKPIDSLQSINWVKVINEKIHIQDKSHVPQKLLQTTLLDCLKSITLCDKKKIVPIFIEKLYRELGPKEGTTLHKALETNIGFLI